MDGHVDVYLHHGGNLVTEPKLKYLGGGVHIVEDFDIDFFIYYNYQRCLQKKLGYKNVEHAYVLEPSINMNE